MTAGTSTLTSQDFTARLLGLLNSGMLTPMIGIGHRTRLFDVMATLPPSSSLEIAEAAGLDERYVREWLGAMSTGGIVDHDPASLTFVLTREHVGAVTRAAGSGNLAAMAQWVGCWPRLRTTWSTASTTVAACPMGPSLRDCGPSKPRPAASATTPTWSRSPWLWSPVW